LIDVLIIKTYKKEKLYFIFNINMNKESIMGAGWNLILQILLNVCFSEYIYLKK
jgi:hypothetical protein